MIIFQNPNSYSFTSQNWHKNAAAVTLAALTTQLRGFSSFILYVVVSWVKKSSLCPRYQVTHPLCSTQGRPLKQVMLLVQSLCHKERRTEQNPCGVLKAGVKAGLVNMWRAAFECQKTSYIIDKWAMDPSALHWKNRRRKIKPRVSSYMDIMYYFTSTNDPMSKMFKSRVVYHFQCPGASSTHSLNLIVHAGQPWFSYLVISMFMWKRWIC